VMCRVFSAAFVHMVFLGNFMVKLLYIYIIDIERGEGLKYVKQQLKDFKVEFPNCRGIFGYDIMCKLITHLTV
jgi:hypothetical protein